VLVAAGILVCVAYRLTHRPISLETLRTITLTVLSPGEEVSADDLVERVKGQGFFNADSIVRGLRELECLGLISTKRVISGSSPNVVDTYYILLTRKGIEARIRLLDDPSAPYRS
jgi:DNA-binding PadR family transcriptional regulator